MHIKYLRDIKNFFENPYKLTFKLIIQNFYINDDIEHIHGQDINIRKIFLAQS